jgi:hypothetical protein
METVTVASGRVVIRCGPQVHLDVSETIRPLRSDRRRRMRVVARVVISTGSRGGRVEVGMGGPARRGRTAVLLGGRRPAVAADELTFQLGTGATRVLVVVEHSPRTSAGSVLAAVIAEDSGVGLVPEPEFRFELPASGELEAIGVEDEDESRAVPQAAPELPADSGIQPVPQLAQVGASMPATVALGEVVLLRVRLSRGELRVRAGDANDEQVIVVRPDRPLSVSVLRRGFELASTQPDEPVTGTRQLRLPAPGEPDAFVTFGLRAAHAGPGEVQVVVRQDAAQPLATLRLTPTVLPPGTAGVQPPTPPDHDDVELTTSIADGVQPFLAPHSLTIDENFVGRTSSLSFELVLPDFRRSYTHVVPDKVQLLTDLFAALDDTWRAHKDKPDHLARSAAFHAALQTIGTGLAAAVLPTDLRDELRDRVGTVTELTVITSGETDIPWELVHVGGDEATPDPDGLGFLGRAGLVRWVYNTRHPIELQVRSGAAYYLIPRYADPTLALALPARERTYLAPFRPRAVRPGSRRGLARLLGSGQVDLLHFAGHGRSDDAVIPPVREMLLSTYRQPVGEAARRRGGTFTLDDLRATLPEREPLAFPSPGPIVVVNACRLGQPPSTRSEVGGFAETFLRGGAAAFVGCLWSVGDEPARSFVETFYARLDAGATIANATIEAREAARTSGDLTWLAYTVYAHPDARLAGRPHAAPNRPVTRQEQRMSAGITTQHTITQNGARRAPGLGPNELAAIHPYVLSVPDGRLADGPSTPPTSVQDYRSTRADVDRLFDTVLPTFLEGRQQPVPLVIWAHGGLVDKAAGLGIAHLQVEWWKTNGCFPVHFVWETGFAESLWDAIKDNLPFGGRAIGDLLDTLVEQAVRAIPASEPTWRAMKTNAELASTPETGGAWYFAQKLAEFVAGHPGEVTVHAAGHSAGSIFHTHLLPRLLEAGLPRVESLSLLAPAVRVAEFKQRLMTPSVLDRIARMTMFTMSEPFEKQDSCLGIYGKSLLYMIRAALEQEPQAEILGLQECVLRDPDLTGLFGAPGSGTKGEVVWSRTVGGGPFSSSDSISHGAFDNDPQTMDSMARRIVGREQLQQRWPTSRLVPSATWIAPDDARAYLDARAGNGSRAGGRRRALCIGIDDYPTPHNLRGCVADATEWQQALVGLGFDVELLVNGAATRENMLERIKELIVNGQPGDVLALQYAGHGTTVPDLDGDEAVEDSRTGSLVDEAICPVDFAAGNLIVDDDLGEIWDLLPSGVSLTMFFDSCHSGGSQRELRPVPAPEPDALPRLVSLSRATVRAYRDKRGHQRRTATSRDHDRGVFFAACQPDQVAWESGGHGDFTRRAVPLLRAAAPGTTNLAFYELVKEAFGDLRRQDPVLLAHGLDARALLSPDIPGRDTPAVPAGPLVAGVSAPAANSGSPVVTGALVPDGPTPRDKAIATILRGMADLVES